MGFFDAFNSIVKPRPETKEELISMITTYMATGDSLNNIDVSAITDMSHLFEGSGWNGDISSWDVSHVTNMERMFRNSKFNGDISKWDVSNVENMEGLFSSSEFNGDISKWNVSKVTNMRSLFYGTKFTGDISGWDVSNVTNMRTVFYKSKFNGDISRWNVSKVQTMESMFMYSEFNGDISGWDVSNVENIKDVFKGSKFKGNIFNWHVDKVQDVSSLWDGGWSPEDSQMLKNRFCRETTEPNKSEKQSAAQENTQNSAKEESVNSEINDILAQFGDIFGGGFGKPAPQPAETKKDTSESKPKSAGAFSGASGNCFVDPRDGQKYRTVKIGGQIWMAENLRYKCKSGCYAYNDEEKKSVMGRLYEWDVIQEACPPGWHLPSMDEWNKFSKYVGNDCSKLASRFWAEELKGYLPSIPEFTSNLPPGRYRDAEKQKYELEKKKIEDEINSKLDTLGFSLYPSGYREYFSSHVTLNSETGEGYDIQYYGSSDNLYTPRWEARYWTSNEDSFDKAKYFGFCSTGESLYASEGIEHKLMAYAIRCIKD